MYSLRDCISATDNWKVKHVFRNCFFYFMTPLKTLVLGKQWFLFFHCIFTFVSLLSFQVNFTREVEIQVGEFCAGGHHHPRVRQVAILVVTLIHPLPFYSTKTSVPLSSFILSF
jgi:hypothetical protein